MAILHNHLYYYSLPEVTVHPIGVALAIIDMELDVDFPIALGDCVVWLAAYEILSVAGDTKQSQIAQLHFQNSFSIL